MSNKKYWQSFGALTNSEEHHKSAQKEFQEELLPIEELDHKGLLDAKQPRRDFLKYLGFSTAAAALAASCKTPVRKALPYVVKPDTVTAGIANYYASTFINGGEAIPVVVKQRDGRPIKIEGNELASLTKGGTTARSQASVLDLYDPTRLRYPMQKSNSGNYKEVQSIAALDQAFAQAVTAVNGKPIVLLTGSINSPSAKKVIENFLAKYTNSKHIQYDAVSNSGILEANKQSFGKAAIPFYQLEKAKVIVSLGADFLGTWVYPVQYAQQYAQNRKIDNKNPQLSKHIQFESNLSLTGSNADDRFTHKPSQTGLVAQAILAKLTGGAMPAGLSSSLQKGIEQAAQQLSQNKGAGVVLSGSNDANVQLVVNAINQAINAYGNVIDWGKTTNTKQGSDADMVKLAQDLAAGTIGGLIVYGVNPVYSYPDGKKLASDIAKLPMSVSLNPTLDETAEQCKLLMPAHHWLESWGDAEPVTGYYSLMQPTINPLFKTRQFEDSLLAWTVPTTVNTVSAVDSTAKTAQKVAKTNTYEEFFRNYWIGVLGTEALYEKALQDGVIEPTTPAAASTGSYNSGALANALSKIAQTKSGNYEAAYYQKVSMTDGSQANNPWLQELPDPISKVTWDNYAMISPALAKTLLGIDVINPNQKDADKYEVNPEKPVLNLTINGRTLNLPAVIIPGIDNNTIAIAYGYGRGGSNSDNDLDRIGRAATGAGKNIFPHVVFDGVSMLNAAVIASVAKAKDTYAVAQTQVHGSNEGRPIIYETNLKSYQKDSTAVTRSQREELHELIPNGYSSFEKDGTIYPTYDNPGAKWGMSIDLNSCTGCSACVVACTAENNVSVVGKTQVKLAHDMHWLRIDRYFTGSSDNPDVVFQPMLCQHCDNAPCENVCPVAATNHSSEGLNQMTYNRCIGTRYCANNCPYKVRRFNWLDYNGADSFKNNQKPLIGTYLNEVTNQMNDDLTRMVLNPDVTIRARGVIEKCSFCVQRLQDAKLQAKKEQDPSKVRNVKTACAQACPTNAISFSNINDKQSDVYQIRNVTQKDRNFYVLAQLHVLPSVSYLAKIKNTDREVSNGDEEAKWSEEHAPAETEHHS